MIDRIVTSRGAVVALFAVSTLLLASMGGAIVAAPVTVPLLVVTARRRAGAARVVATVLAALTVGEVAWALTYLAAGEARPWIWLAPLAAVLAVPAAVARPRFAAH